MTPAAPLRAEREEPRAQLHPGAASLALEHQRLARYLLAVRVTPYQIDKYIAFHRTRPLRPRSAFDALLMALARSGDLGLLLADAYSGTLYRASLLRVKLTLTLAILECSPPSFSAIDAPDRGGRLAYLHLSWAVLEAALVLVCACALLAPVHAWVTLTASRQQSDS